MSFELKKLPYAFDALEPYIDAVTMEIHHGKHHAAYTNNLNAALQGSEAETKTIEDILSKIWTQPVAVRNNGGGFFNHNLYWEVMAPGGAPQPEGDLLKAIDHAFGSYENFKDAFAKAALTRFGSGWAWLVKQGDSLVISSTPNQDNPLMDLADVRGIPVLGVDVWEHAYYLKYQNRRPDYVEAFFKVVNWDEVAKRFKG
jgi:Fe-Mn family superoxide dismutase